VLEEGRHDWAVGELETDGDAAAGEALAQLLGPVLDGLRAVLDHRELDGFGARDLQADIVLAVGPVDADECGELGDFFLHGDLLDLGSGRDMQRRAQRRQYGEPVMAAVPECSLRARHTRGLESELVSVTRSALQVRSPRVHVPLRSSRVASGRPKWNSPPIKPLQQSNASPVRSNANPCRDAAAVPAAPRGRDTLERDLGVRC
jgi:hypothetical protein